MFGNEQVLVTGNKNWSVIDEFKVDATYPTTDKCAITSAIPRNENLVLWGSWTGADNHTGKLVSPAFKAPAILSMFLAGYPNALGNELFLERIDNQQRFVLKTVDPRERWVDFKWVLPPSWHNKQTRLIAIDGAKATGGWLGASSPRKATWLSMINLQIPSLAIFPLYALHFSLFLIPGIFVATFMVQRDYLHQAFTLIMSITISSTVGYFVFWIYFFNYNIGKVASILIIVASSVYLVNLFNRRSGIKKLLFSDLIVPLSIAFFTGILYLAILYLIYLAKINEITDIVPQIRFLKHGLPPDNIIPMLFAEKLYTGQDPRNLLGDWLSSDRPPLQTGIVLAQYPLAALSGLGIGIHYQILSTIVQCSWVAAMWALCRTIGRSGKRIAIVMAFSIFSGFFLLNSVYVWSKLLAGAFFVFAFTLLLQSVLASRSPSTFEITIAFAATALGMLAHGGVIFTLPAIALIIMRPRYFPNVRRLLVACAIFVLLLAPWSAYQKFYNPPGDRLIKWHIGGVIPIDQRPALQAIIDSYRKSSIQNIVSNKFENLKVLVGNPTIEITSPETRRNGEFFNVFKSISFLNVAWLIVFIKIFTKQFFSGREGRAVKIILGLSLVSLIFWILAMFGPGTTVIHQGSYATMILLFAGLGIVVSSLPGWLTYSFLLIQIFAFSLTWVLTPTPVFTGILNFMPNLPTVIVGIMPNIPVTILGIFALAGIAIIFKKLSQQSMP